MTKKEQKEQLEYIKSILNENIELDGEKEMRTLGFIFNILTSNSVMNRYVTTRFGNIEDNDTIGIAECINYIGKKLTDATRKEGENNGY